MNSPGDMIVHRPYGVGKFGALEFKPSHGVEAECFKVKIEKRYEPDSKVVTPILLANFNFYLGSNRIEANPKPPEMGWRTANRIFGFRAKPLDSFLYVISLTHDWVSILRFGR